MIVATLEQEGIQATTTGTHTAGFRAEAPGWVKLFVTETDLLEAQSVRRQVVLENTNVAWSQVDVGEPTRDESDSEPAHWLTSLSLWRRMASVLIVLFLIWVVVGFIVDAVLILFELIPIRPFAN